MVNPCLTELSPSLHRYKQVKFTKHPQKYYKYYPKEVEEMIQKFFDTLI